MKRPRKVALISVFDYPRDAYRAYWAIEVSGDDVEGWRWAARIFGYEPVGWAHQGKVTAERPDVPMPVYPQEVKVSQAAYARLSSGDQAKVRERQDEWRRKCSEIYEAHPKPVYLIAEALDVCPTRDEADEAAQRWVLEQMKGQRHHALPPFSDEEITVMVAELDAARLAKDFGTVDRLRGRLRSMGVGVDEPTEASAAGPSRWFRQSGHALALGPAGMLGAIVAELAAALRRHARELVVLMALGYSTTIRNNRLNAVRDAIDGGAGAGLLRIYDGSRPATCGTATTLLAELTYSDPCAPNASGGTLTFNAITADASANASGTATWYRSVDSTGTCCEDGSVGTSGSDLNLNTTTITAAVQVAVSSKTTTGGNA